MTVRGWAEESADEEECGFFFVFADFEWRRFTDGKGDDAQDDAYGADDDAGDAGISTFPLRAL